MAAGYTRAAIRVKLEELRNSGKIGPFKSKTVAYDYKIWLEQDSDYTTFFLLWEPKSSWHKPTILNEPYEDG